MKHKKNGFWNGTDSRWESLINRTKPASDGDSYYFREEDWGHITPYLQNPRNLTAKGYLKEAINLFNKGENLNKNGEYVKAYEYYLVAYLLVVIAGHIDYAHAVRAFRKTSGNSISKAVVVELLKKNNKKLILISEKMLSEKNKIIEVLKEKNLESDMQKINKKYNMHVDIAYLDPKKDLIKPSKKSSPKVEKKLEIVKPVDKTKTIESEIKDLEFDNIQLGKALAKASEETKKILNSEIEHNTKEIEKLKSELQSLPKAA